MKFQHSLAIQVRLNRNWVGKPQPNGENWLTSWLKQTTTNLELVASNELESASNHALPHYSRNLKESFRHLIYIQTETLVESN